MYESWQGSMDGSLQKDGTRKLKRIPITGRPSLFYTVLPVGPCLNAKGTVSALKSVDEMSSL